ncbi:transposon Tf2-8 polyprotein [Trichonephila clavipes]|nr:transposon Tf2-8 polyprotein [Trichonephila clavipes]
MTGNQLDVIIDKKPIRALVDSGASFSVISDKYRRFLKKVLFADAKSVMLKVADGNFVRPIGKCVFTCPYNQDIKPGRHKCSSRRQQTFALQEKYCYTVHEKQAIELLRKFSGLFTKTDKSTAAKTNVKHRIFTGDHAPINQRAYRVSPTERRIIHEEVQKMLDEGIVQPSESPWSSPVVLEAGLKLNSKCLFAAQVKILGHHVSSNGVRPDPDKIKAVRNFPTPKNIHDIRSFLGLCSYFRRFIKGFCYLAEPLQSLLKSGVEFHWGPEEVEAFNSLKKALTSDPVLGMYDERASTEIHTDASGYGIGAV